MIKQVLFYIYCGFAGGAIASGFVAFITLLGVFEKLAERFHSVKLAKNLESAIMVGVFLGNLLFLLEAPLPLHGVGFVIFMLFGGIFIGALAGALAETLQVFPILSRRFRIRTCLPYMLIAAAFGKAIGNIIITFFMNS